MSKSIKNLVKAADDAKKVNPLDLSSDQDLTIGLMNLIAIEDICGVGSDLGEVVRDIRRALMTRIVDVSDERFDISEQLLARTMRLMIDADNAITRGDFTRAYKLYDDAYGMYSLFWGFNMGLVDKKSVLADLGVDSNAQKMVK